MKRNPRSIQSICQSLTSRMMMLVVCTCFASFMTNDLMAADNYYNWFQSVPIKGRIIDDKGSPIAGVSIIEKGTSNGTTSDSEGNFSINVENENAILVISNIGYSVLEIPVKDYDFSNITLTTSAQNLNEVVVIGYGTTRKKDLTGSVASVPMANQEKTAVIGTAQLLQGRVSGVQVIQNQSQPGANFSVRIRGTNSINSGNAPLYVIDGYPGSISDINPNDIASIDVLKDASATAIYGSRGANGVVMITTKRGSSRGTQVNLDAYYGVQTINKLYDMMNATEFARYLNNYRKELNQINNTNDPLPYTEQQINEFGSGTDWQRAILRTAPVSNYTLSITGGDHNTKNYLSLNYFSQDGIIKASDYKRGILRYNLDQTISPRLKFGASTQMNYSYQNATKVNTIGAGNSPSVLWDAVRFNPVMPIRDAEGEYTYVNQPAGMVQPMGNPVAYLENAKEGYYNFGGLANIFAEFSILRELKFRTNLGATYQAGGSEVFVPSFIFASSGVGRASQSSGRSFNYLTENFLTYDKNFNDAHALTATTGFTFQQWYAKGFSAGATNLSSDILGENNLSIGTPMIPTSSFVENALASYFGRINYKLFDKYLFTVTMRADGSSRFGENNKWGYFPSGAFAWRISEEEFIKNVEAISDLKLRLSYGVTGNQEIGSYNSLSQYGNSNYALGTTPTVVTGMFPLNMPNRDLRWESTATSDIGIDIGLWQNRVSITADYYSKKTKDLLLWVSLPTTSGYSSYLSNIGSVSNKGFEFALNTLNIDQEDLKWSTSLNLSTNKNKVIDLGPNKEIPVAYLSSSLFRGQNVNAEILRPGLSIGSFYGYQFDGIWQTQEQITASGTKQAVKPGDPIYRDLNGDSLINGADRTIIGNAIPRFIFGMTNDVSYKNFNLSVFLQGVQGNKVFNANRYDIETAGDGYNKLKYVGTKSWTGPGTSNVLPRITSILRNSIGVTDEALEDASYLRLKTVTLSYNFPNSLLPTIFRNASLYVTGQNLLTFTKYTGYDPEVNSYTDSSNQLSLGIDYNAYPNYRTVTFGVKLGF